LEPPLCVVSSWVIKRVYIIFIWNTISGSSNLDNYFYFWLNLYINITSQKFSSTFLLLLLIIYIVHFPLVRLRSCRVIYYFDTPALGIRHQLFDCVRHGIQYSSMLLFNLAFIILSLIPPCLFIIVALICVICWYMWMILCLLEMILVLCNLLFSSLVINFLWKIWVLLIIFWEWKLSQLCRFILVTT